MSDTVLRFAPTITSGYLHHGHMLNLWLNLWYAHRNGGTVQMRMDCIGDAQELAFRAPWIADGQETVERLVPGARTDFFHRDISAPWLYEAVVERLTGWRVELAGRDDDASWALRMAVVDWLSGVGVVIRGREWQHDAVSHPPQGTEGLTHISLLGRLSDRVVVHIAHPLVLMDDGDKMSKSRNDARLDERDDILVHGVWTAYLLTGRWWPCGELVDVAREIDFAGLDHMDDWQWDERVFAQARDVAVAPDGVEDRRRLVERVCSVVRHRHEPPAPPPRNPPWW